MLLKHAKNQKNSEYQFFIEVFIYFNESPLKMTKNPFYILLKALYVLYIFTFLPWLFGYVEKCFAKKARVNFEIYDVTDGTINKYNTHFVQYLKKKRQPDDEIWSVNRI